MLLNWSTTMHHIYHDSWTCVEEELYLTVTTLLKFVSIIIYHIPPIFLEYERIWFGAYTSLRLTIVNNGKYVLSNKLHAMGGICREGWNRYFIIKFSFWWLHNLTSGTYWWIIEHSSYCAVIVTYNYINDKTAMKEWIFYHLQNCTSLHTFRAPLKFIWELMLLCFFYNLICRITLPEGLWIDDHFNNALRYSTDDEGMPARGVISPSIWSILPDHIICNSEFYLIFISLLIW